MAEDSTTGRPVASLVGLQQDWSLAGVRLPVAQVELVGTAPQHRGNRLTERLFASLHQRYAVDGVPVQIIEGIPYFYRRLGYDYALANDGAPTVPATALPATGHDVPDGSSGGRTVRPATVADADDLAGIDRRLADGNALVCLRDVEVWRYEIGGRRPADIARRAVAVLVHDAEVRGYLVYAPRLSAAGELTVVAAACKRPAEWPQAAAAMNAHLGNVGRRYEASIGRSPRSVCSSTGTTRWPASARPAYPKGPEAGMCAPATRLACSAGCCRCCGIAGGQPTCDGTSQH